MIIHDLFKARLSLICGVLTVVIGAGCKGPKQMLRLARTAGVTAEISQPQDTMKYYVLLFTVLALQVFAAKAPFGQLQEEQKFNDYTVRIYFDKDASSGCFEVLRSGRQVYFHSGQFFGVGDVDPDGNTHTNTPIKMGQSITSDKQPNLLVTEWTSGNHCCTTFHIFEIGQKFKKIAALEALYFENLGIQGFEGRR